MIVDFGFLIGKRKRCYFDRSKIKNRSSSIINPIINPMSDQALGRQSCFFAEAADGMVWKPIREASDGHRPTLQFPVAS